MQKFHKGDLVRVAKDLGPTMSHFKRDCDAIVLGSYTDEYGRGMERHDHTYSIFIKNRGGHSWYDEDQLTLVQASRLDLLAEWEAEVTARRTQAGDLDWIFSHGQELIDICPPDTAQALATCLGLGDLCGSHGEYIVFFTNALAVLQEAKPFLATGDKAGWLAHCARVKEHAG